MRHVYLFLGIWSLASVAQGTALDTSKWQTLAGQPTQLASEHNTQLVLFWASWCTECKEKLTSTLPAWQKQKGIGITAINIDSNLKRAVAFVESAKVGIPVVRDPSKSLQKALKVFSVPHWAVFKKTDSGWSLIDQAGGFDDDQVLGALGKAKEAA